MWRKLRGGTRGRRGGGICRVLGRARGGIDLGDGWLGCEGWSVRACSLLGVVANSLVLMVWIPEGYLVV